MATKVFWTFYGPRLLRIFKHKNISSHDYEPSILEWLPDKFIQTLHAAWTFSCWTSPVWGIIMYRKEYFNQEGIVTLTRLAVSLAVVYTAAYIIRGIGRMTNSDYRTFVNALVEARQSNLQKHKRELAHFDFDFWAWPADFRWDEGTLGEKKSASKHISSRRAQAIERSSYPCRILSYIAMHTFGQRMVYPGATALMNYILSGMLKQGRSALIEEKKGQRAKLIAEDGNEIDTMFVDRRNKSENGDTLVIGFEGNAGFYEMGCTGTPMDLNYSVLGWNHPGFGGSTGIPYPAQEQKAVDVVVQYAIQKLGFTPDNIVLFAWSIGGYTASFTARTYPDVKFVVLDATFDDIVPLAIAKMPESWKNLVALSLRTYMDLNIAEQLVEYPGPILLIRRTRDEIITTDAPPDRPPVLLSNRGNFLLLKLLQHRYPSIVDNSTLPVMKDFLGLETVRQVSMLENHGVELKECNDFFVKHAENHGYHFPFHVDVPDIEVKTRLALFLITVHMENFESTHCTPLPGIFFHRGWLPGHHF